MKASVNPLNLTRTISCCVVLAISIALVACKERTVKAAAPAQPEIASKPKTDHDFGVVTNDTITYECTIAGEKAIKLVESVSTSCGCTASDIKKGMMLDTSKPFKIVISLENKQPGDGVQSLGITFADGSTFTTRLKYKYQPVPYATPRFVIFKKEENTANVVLFFPGEEKVSLKKIVYPEFIKHSIEPSGLPIDQLPLRFVFDGSLKDPIEGAIQIETTSKRRPTFSIPFLVLKN